MNVSRVMFEIKTEILDGVDAFLEQNTGVYSSRSNFFRATGIQKWRSEAKQQLGLADDNNISDEELAATCLAKWGGQK